MCINCTAAAFAAANLFFAFKIQDVKKENNASQKGDCTLKRIVSCDLRQIALDLAYDIVGSFIYALGIVTFAKAADFAPGGISGLALIVHYLWQLPIGIVTLILNIPLVLISYKIVGRSFMLKSFKTMIINTIFLDLIFPMLPLYTGEPFVASLFSGICIGAGLALFYMRGSSSGGTDFLIMTLRVVKPHMSIGILTVMIDFVVILLGRPVFGTVDSVLYGLIASFATSIVVDKIMYGIDAGTLAIIITTKGEAAAHTISEVTGRGSTAITAMGTYSKENKDVILCACSNKEAYAVRKAVFGIDEGAFVMVTETSSVYGEGFIEKKDK